MARPTRSAIYFRQGVAAPAGLDVSRCYSLEEVRKLSAKVDLFARVLAPARSCFAWVKLSGDRYRLGLGKEERVEIARDLLGTWRVRVWSVGKELGGRVAFKSVEQAIAAAEAWVKMRRPGALALVDPNAAWRSLPATAKQRATLRRFRVGERKLRKMTPGQAADLMDKIFGRRRIARGA